MKQGLGSESVSMNKNAFKEENKDGFMEEDDDYENDSFLVEDHEVFDDFLDKGNGIKTEKKSRSKSKNKPVHDKLDQWVFQDIPGIKKHSKNIVLEFLKVFFQIWQSKKHFLFFLFEKFREELMDRLKLDAIN